MISKAITVSPNKANIKDDIINTKGIDNKAVLFDIWNVNHNIPIITVSFIIPSRGSCLFIKLEIILISKAITVSPNKASIKNGIKIVLNNAISPILLITINKTPNKLIKIISFTIPFNCSPVFVIAVIIQICVEIIPKTYKAEIIIPILIIDNPVTIDRAIKIVNTTIKIVNTTVNLKNSDITFMSFLFIPFIIDAIVRIQTTIAIRAASAIKIGIIKYFNGNATIPSIIEIVKIGSKVLIISLINFNSSNIISEFL